MLVSLRLHVPLPLDHFFFCFLPPVAAGALGTVSVFSSCPSLQRVMRRRDVPFCRMCVVAEERLSAPAVVKFECPGAETVGLAR